MSQKRVPLIGVLTKQLDNWTSGSGHHLHEMMRYALKLNNGRFKFLFFHYQASDNPVYKDPQVKEVIIPRNPFKASKIIKTHQPDVVHYPLLTVYAPVWGVKAKKVGTLHASEQLLVPECFSKVEVLHERFVVPYYIRKMNHLITVSHTSRDYYAQAHTLPVERFTVCYNGIDPAYRVLDKNQLTAQKKYNTGDNYLFHISRFSARKNPRTLLEGYLFYLQQEQQKGAKEPCKLVIAGGGWNTPEIVQFIEKHSLSKMIILTGFLDTQDAVELYNGARAFLFPSLAEGFGMPNVEAMACGCPVITTNAFAIPEIVGDAALKMPDPKDHHDLAANIKLLVDEKGLRDELIQKGFERLKLFSWQESAEKLLKVYENLAAGSKVL